MKKIILFISFIALGITTQATVHVVSSKNNSGTGTLRSKIAAAISGDTIRFNPNLIANGSDSIVLASEIAFSKSLTITGLYTPADTLFISGGGTNRMFNVTVTPFVVFDSLVLRNGYNVSDGGAMFVQNVDSVALRNSTVKKNRCGSGNLFFHSSSSFSGSAKVIIDNCDISNNRNIPYGNGAGVCFLGKFASDYLVEIRNSKIRNNRTSSGSSYGGGMLVFGSDSTTMVSVIDSEISGNSAAHGGGIYMTNRIGESYLYVIGSTISGNMDTSVGQSYGTGIYSEAYLGGSTFIEIEGSTISNNKADSCIQGGGIYCCSVDSTRSVIVKNSTIVNNTATYGGGVFIQGYTNLNPPIFNIQSSIVGLNGPSNMSINQSTSPTFTSLGYNIFSDSALVDTVSTDQLNIDSAALNLSSLSYNGGYTPTMMPIFPSVAINNGNPLDTSDAQNAHISGIRDVGAAEVCSPTYVTDSIVSCDSYTWLDGITYTSSDTSAIYVVANAAGCDSIITLNLTINYLSTYIDTHFVCDSLVWIDGNTYYTNNNTAMHTLSGANSHGCDSVVTLNLTINSSQTTDVISSCGAYTWVDGNTYTSNNNTATHTFTNALGCDSIVTLDLTINGTTYGTETVVSCDSYTWNGITYTSSNNTATDTLVNSNGCDSIVTLDLTILQSTTFIDVIASCDAITWLDGNTYAQSNNTATHTLSNAAGCDSVITLNFTLLQSTTATDAIASCSEITWIDGNVYNASTSGPTFTIPNAAGCDSVVTLNFTLLEVDTAVTRNYLTLTAQATNATYQWIDCTNGILTGETNAAFTATQNGNYQVEVTQNGCVDTSACFSITNVGIQQAALLGVNVYPNPTSDVLHIDKGSNASLEITVTNSAGAVVYNSSTQDQITTINMAKMASGVYLITLRNESGLKVERVVKR